MNLIFLGYVAFFLFFSLLGYFILLKINTKQYMLFFFLLICSLIALSLNLEILTFDSDIGRQLSIIDSFRNNGISSLTNAMENDLLWGKLFLFYIVSLTYRNEFIMTLNVIIVYSIFFSIIARKIQLIEYRQGVVNSRPLSRALFFFFLTNTFVAVTGSIRYQLACSITWVAIELLKSKEKPRIFAIFLILLSLTIHQGIVLLISSFLLAIVIKNKEILFISALIAAFVSLTISPILIQSPIPYLNYLGRSIESAKNAYEIGSGSVTVGNTILIILLVLGYFNTRVQIETIESRTVITCLVFALALIRFPQIAQRLLFAASWNSIDFFETLSRSKNYKSKSIAQLSWNGLIIPFVLLAYYDFLVIVQVYSFI